VAALLQRYRPVIQYDSHECFYADSVGIMTDRVTPGGPQGQRCNTLRNAAGKVIAAAKPSSGQAKLNLGFLRKQYGIGAAATRDDYLDATGHDCVADARRMHALPHYANQVYGHAVRDKEGRLWLQYWFFYYYNNRAFLGIGVHEGDWEMMQIRLDAKNKPDVLTYSQHREGARASWANVERATTPDGPVPVVYSARGSHASYFTPGVHKEAPVVPDYNDAKGPRIRPDVVVISDNAPAWVAWPGRWGSTPRRNYLESDSPRGPSQHGQWRAPASFHGLARPAAPSAATRGAERALPIPSAPKIVVHRDAGHAVIDYRFKSLTRGQPAPVGLVVSIDGAEDELPPATYTFPVTGLEGSVEHPLELEDRPYVVRVTAFSQGGAAGDAVTARLGT
jgi:Vacuolar protein sorting-associated protein 62